MTLHKLTFSISLLAASLMLAVPAQAETWSCSYHDKVRKGPMPFMFVRNGDNFDAPAFATTFQIVRETSKVIHLLKTYDGTTTASYSVSLFKQTKRFAMARLSDNKPDPVVEGWGGSCLTH